MLTAIWPLFALICFGSFLTRTGFPSDGFWKGADRINYVILFPALLVASLAQAPVTDPNVMQLGAAAIATILIASVALFLLRHLARIAPSRFGPVLQGAIRFNTYLGLAVTAVLLGPAGTERAAIYLAVAVPLVNILSIMALSQPRHGAAAVGLLRTVLKNPLVIACLLGLVLALSGAPLPSGAARLLDLLAQASLPLGLLCVGAALRLSALHKEALVLGGVAVLRLVLMPVLAAGVAWACDLGGPEAAVLVIFSAIPTAPTAYVLTQQMGGDANLMAGIVTLQTLLAFATLPIVAWLF